MESFKSASSCHVLGASRLDPLCQLWSNVCWVKWNNQSPWSAICAPVDTVWATFTAARVYHWLLFSLPQASHVLFSKAANQTVVVSPPEIKECSICPDWTPWYSCWPSPLASINPPEWQAWSLAYQVHPPLSIISPQTPLYCIPSLPPSHS